MKTLSRALILALGVSAFGLVGCQSTQCATKGDGAACCGDGACEEGDAATISQVSNTTCPVSGGAVKSSVSTVSFEGKEVGFCCGGCAEKFAKMTDAEKTAALGG